MNERFTKGAIMNLRDVYDLLDAEILVGGDQMDEELTTAFAADTMSDLLAFGRAGGILLTRMTSPQVVRMSDIMDIVAVIMVRGKIPSPEVIQLAKELHVPIMATRFPQFEAAGLLYAKGLRGNIEKVDERHATV
jgi:predicted transcriptional regulator